jgi:hypothetical protein
MCSVKITILEQFGADVSEATAKLVTANAGIMFENRIPRIEIRTESSYLRLKSEFLPVAIEGRYGTYFEISYKHQGRHGRASLHVVPEARLSGPSKAEARTRAASSRRSASARPRAVRFVN